MMEGLVREWQNRKLFKRSVKSYRSQRWRVRRSYATQSLTDDNRGKPQGTHYFSSSQSLWLLLPPNQLSFHPNTQTLLRWKRKLVSGLSSRKNRVHPFTNQICHLTRSLNKIISVIIHMQFLSLSRSRHLSVHSETQI